MVPSFNDFLFFFSALFGLNIPFISEQSNVSIDLEKKTVHIEYIDLMYLPGSEPYAAAFIDSIEKATAFNMNYDGLTLVSKKIVADGDKLNATLDYSFTNPGDVYMRAYMSISDKGNILYATLPLESIVSTNGKISKQKERTVVTWDAGTKILELNLKHGDVGSREFDDRKSLLKYWKK